MKWVRETGTVCRSSVPEFFTDPFRLVQRIPGDTYYIFVAALFEYCLKRLGQTLVLKIIYCKLEL